MAEHPPNSPAAAPATPQKPPRTDRAGPAQWTPRPHRRRPHMPKWGRPRGGCLYARRQRGSLQLL